MSLPFKTDEDPFDRTLWGSYGVFETNESLKLSFVLSSVPIDKIDWISTATEAFDVSEIDFDELIQRDIAHDRVLEIVEEYLEEGSERVVFFPPLLATLIVLEDEQLKDQYDDYTPKVNEGFCEFTWDHDKFQVSLPISEKSETLRVECNGDEYPVYNFGCKLRFNSRETKLVVLDGQHRLSALRHLASNKEKKHIVSGLQIPVCLVYTPGAMKGSNESIKRNLRELFVRINTTGRRVSGHFIRLLDDTKLSSAAAREIANLFKEYRINSASGLHLIEWNQRSDGKTHQTERPYSITTISILADALESSIFYEPPRFRRLLRLTELEGDWPDDDSARGFENIRDGEFSHSEQTLIRKQIREHLAGPVFALLTTPSVYNQLVEKLGEATNKLDDLVSKGRDGAHRFREVLKKEFRKPDIELDGEEVVLISKEFESVFGGYKTSDLNEPYFLNVFQQGLIRCWSRYAELGMRNLVNLPLLTKAFIEAFERLALDPKQMLFSVSRSYTNHTLYRNSKVSFTKGSRDQWSNLLWASVLNGQVQSVLRTELTSAEEFGEDNVNLFVEACIEEARDAFFSFMDFFEAQEGNFLKKNWESSWLSDEQISEVADAYAALREDSDSERFDALIDRYSRERSKMIRDRLENALGVTKINRAE